MRRGSTGSETVAAVSFPFCRVMELALIPERRVLCFWFQFGKRGGNLILFSPELLTGGSLSLNQPSGRSKCRAGSRKFTIKGAKGHPVFGGESKMQGIASA